MKFKKESLSSLLIIALLLILAACSKMKEKKEQRRLRVLKSINQKITIFQSKVEISDQLEALAKEYTRRNRR